MINDGIGNSRYAADILPVHILCAPLFRLWRDLYLHWEWRLPKYDLQRENHVSDYLSGLSTLLDHNRLLEARIRQLQELLKCKIVFGKNDLCNSIDKSITSKLMNDDENKQAVIDTISNLFHFQRTIVSSPTHNNNANNHSRVRTKDNSVTSDQKHLSQPTIEQLKCEMSIINVNWTHCFKSGSLCCVCNSLLALSNQSVHCHSCGLLTCSRCIHSDPPTIPSLWSNEQRSVQFCNSCVSELRNTCTYNSSTSSFHVKHFTQTKSLEIPAFTTTA